MFRLMFRLLFLLLLSLLLNACNSDGDEAPPASGGGDNQYIVWEGSANEEVVVDVDGDAVKFEVGTGYMYFGNTTYTNARVDTRTADFILDGQVVGTVSLVLNIYDDSITALVALDGTYLDIHGTEDNLVVANTNTVFQPASVSQTLTAMATEQDGQKSYFDIQGTNTHFQPALVSQTPTTMDTELSVQKSPPMPRSNAFVDQNSEYPQMGILQKAQ